MLTHVLVISYNIAVVYPFLHIATNKTDMARMKLIPPPDVTRMNVMKFEQGIYKVLESSEGKEKLDRFLKNAHYIFLGTKVNSDIQVFRYLDTNWRKWSKVDYLLSMLLKNGIFIQNVTCLKKTAPMTDRNVFMYCCLIGIKLNTNADVVNCLNIIQSVRGHTVPGYVTLFHHTDGQPGEGARSSSSLDNLMSTLESDLSPQYNRRGHSL